MAYILVLFLGFLIGRALQWYLYCENEEAREAGEDGWLGEEEEDDAKNPLSQR